MAQLLMLVLLVILVNPGSTIRGRPMRPGSMGHSPGSTGHSSRPMGHSPGSMEQEDPGPLGQGRGMDPGMGSSEPPDKKDKHDKKYSSEKTDKHEDGHKDDDNAKRFGHISMPIWGVVLLVCSCLATIAIVIVVVKFCNCQKKMKAASLTNLNNPGYINPVMLPHGVTQITNLSDTSYENEKVGLDFDTDNQFTTMRYTASPPPAYDEIGAAGWIVGSEEKVGLPDHAMVTADLQRPLNRLPPLRPATLPPIQGTAPRPGSAKPPQPLPAVVGDKY